MVIARLRAFFPSLPGMLLFAPSLLVVTCTSDVAAPIIEDDFGLVGVAEHLAGTCALDREASLALENCASGGAARLIDDDFAFVGVATPHRG